MKERVVNPEILDRLDENDPAVRANRRDLRLLNRLMGGPAWIAHALRSRLSDEKVGIVELGAGDGTLGKRIHQAFGEHISTYRAIDQCSPPADWPTHWAWTRGDLREVELQDNEQMVIGNLILHQFEDHELQNLGARLRSRANCFLFNEPARFRIHRYQLMLAYVFGLHRISRHDGQVSIRAGFRGNELPEALGLSREKWQWTCCHNWLGCYRMSAWRI